MYSSFFPTRTRPQSGSVANWYTTPALIKETFVPIAPNRARFSSDHVLVLVRRGPMLDPRSVSCTNVWLESADGDVIPSANRKPKTTTIRHPVHRGRVRQTVPDSLPRSPWLRLRNDIDACPCSDW